MSLPSTAGEHAPTDVEVEPCHPFEQAVHDVGREGVTTDIREGGEEGNFAPHGCAAE